MDWSRSRQEIYLIFRPYKTEPTSRRARSSLYVRQLYRHSFSLSNEACQALSIAAGIRFRSAFYQPVFPHPSVNSTSLFSFSYAKPVRMTPRGQILLVLRKYLTK